MVQGIDELGFLPGWGNTVGRMRESFQLLLDILQVGRQHEGVREACACTGRHKSVHDATWASHRWAWQQEKRDGV